MNAAIASRLLGDPQAGFDSLNRAQDLRRQLLTRGDNGKLLRDLGMGEYNLGVFHLKDGNGETGEKHLLQAAQAFENVLSSTLRDAATEQRLAETYRLLADRYSAVPDTEAAVAYYQEAASVLSMLSMRNPDVPHFSAALASIYLNLANAERSRSETAAAAEALEIAIDILDGVCEAIPNVPQYRRDLAVAFRTLASLHGEAGQRKDAIEKALRARELLKQLSDEFPDDDDYSEHLRDTELLIRSLNET